MNSLSSSDQIVVEERGKIRIISFLNEEIKLDEHALPHLQDVLTNLIDKNIFCLVIDFKNVIYFTSTNMGIILGLIHQIRNKKGDIKLANVSEKIKNLFHMLGFLRVIEIHNSSKEAVDSFSDPRETTSSFE